MEARSIGAKATVQPRWSPSDVPGAAAPLATRWLGSLFERGGRCLAVRFPAGWERPLGGHYEVDEEFILLRGALTIGSIESRPGDYVMIPAGWHRATTVARQGALAVALFHGPPRWSSGVATMPADAVVRPIASLPLEPGPGGVPARRLSRRGAQELWIAPTADGSFREGAILVVSLRTLRPVRLCSGESLPDLRPPLLMATNLD